MAREVLGIAGAVIGGIYGGVQGAQIGYMVGSAVGSIIDPPNVSGPSLGEGGAQTSRDGEAIPVLWGTHFFKGNIIAMTPTWEKTKKSGGGMKGGTTTTEIRRYRTFAIGLGRSFHGPIGSIQRVWENNKLIYDVANSYFLISGDNQAFLLNVNIYLGTETQLPDPELEAYTGVGTTPAYRGLAYIVFVNKDITDFASAIPTYGFEISTGEGYQSKDYPADP